MSLSSSRADADADADADAVLQQLSFRVNLSLLLAGNVSAVCNDVDTKSAKFVLVAVFLAALNCLIVGGNLLVIAAVLTYTKLRKCLTNQFVLSLAVSDLLLGLAVLPFSSVTMTLDKQWVFGPTYCTIWLAVDVWLCTASILNLVAISFERYLAIRKPMAYSRYMTEARVHVAIVAIWILAFLICLPSTFQNSNSVADSEARANLRDNRTVIATPSATVTLSGSGLNAMSNKLLSRRFDKASRNGSGLDPDSDLASRLLSTLNVSYLKCLTREECTIAESSTVYVLYSFSFSFLIPAIAMIVMYSRIYATARSAMHNIQTGQIVAKGLKEGEKVTMRVHFGKRDSAVGMLALTTIGGVARQALRSTKRKQQQQQQQQQQQVQLGVESAVETSRGCQLSNAGAGNDEEMRRDGEEEDDSETSGRATSLRRHTVLSVTERDGFIETHLEQMKKIEQLEQLYRKNAQANARKQPKQRETKAAKVCFILVFGFLAMWMPFFIAYLVTPFCTDCIPAVVWDVCFFLGYLNSAVNVIIYAAFSRDFRTAFVGLLTGRLLGERKRRQEQVRMQFATRALIDATLRLQGNVLTKPTSVGLYNHLASNSSIALGRATC